MNVRFRASMFSVCLALAACLCSSGCVAVLAGGIAAGATAGHDRRSIGNVLDDQNIELAASRAFEKEDRLGGARIKSVAHNGTLLLIGEVRDASQRDLAGEAAARVQGVKRVVNELAIGEHAGAWRRGRDAALTARVKTSLINLGIKGFDPTRVNVTAVRGEVYLMGLVTHEEADAATARVSTLRGVRRVVKVFEYID